MDFMARTPTELYLLVPDGDSAYFGMVASEEVMEFLVNEFSLTTLDIIAPSDLEQVLSRPGVRIWGNPTLAHR